MTRNVKERGAENWILERDEIVKERNDLLREQNKMNSSLEYASIIQEALLPPKSFLHELFPDSFIFFRPKDIVSGDFYWMEQFPHRLHKTVDPNNKPDYVMVAAVDCTGHGVPGAFMSILGKTFLHHTTVEHQFSEPALVLTEMNDDVQQTFQGTDGQPLVSDGMDMALLKIDLKTYTVTFAGAKRPLLYTKEGQLYQAQASRKSIGGQLTTKDASFTQQKIDLEAGDCVYLFSDGIVDQFGGPSCEKYLIKRLRKFIQSICHLPMKIQKERIETDFLKWKGNEGQTDDLLVLGIRL